MSSELNPAGSTQNATAGSVNGDASASHSRRQSAVSLPKGASNNTRPGQAINFGSVYDQNAMLSSSPAAQPSSGQHLRGERPTVFGSVTAHESDTKKTTIGFASGKPENGTPTGPGPRSMDFQKLFQGSGSSVQNSSSSTASSLPSQVPVASTPNAASLPPASAATPATLPSNNSVQSPTIPRHNSSSLRPSSGSGHHTGSRPFEPQRPPTQHHSQGGRVPSQAGPPHQSFQPHQVHGHPQGGPQQTRSPHMSNSVPMQTMQPIGGPWQHQQPMAYPPPQYGYHPGYAYQPVPQHWGQQQPAYDLPVTPRSPRHANLSTPSAMTPNGMATTPSMAPSTPHRAANVPLSPSAAHSGVAAPHTPMGLGQPPPTVRPQTFSPAAGFPHHSPSHSFSNSMSPSARQFEPQQKRQSSAIKIVNPETQAAVDLQNIPKTSIVQIKSSPSLLKATPAVLQPAERKPVRIETPEAFQRRVQQKMEEANKKVDDASSGLKSDADKENEDKERQEKENKEREEKERLAAEAEKLAKAEEAERQRKVKEEVEKAKREAEERARNEAEEKAKKEVEEKAAAERKAAQEAEAKVKQEAEQKLQEAKDEAERKEREAKEADEKAAKAKADAEVEATAAALAAAKIKAEEEDAERQRKAKEEEEMAKAATAAIAAATAAATAAEEAKSRLSPIDTQKAADGPTFRGSVADVERMAREASSVPSTPFDILAPRTPGVPQTPRTPGTPGFAGLPAKPMSVLPSSNGIKLDSDALERKKVAAPGTNDTLGVQQPKSDGSSSAASAALGSARFIDNLQKVSYPSNIASPRAELNEQAEPGKFRYDRDFLMQFMGVYTEKPQDLPPLASIGMEGAGMGANSRAGGRRASGMGPPAPPGRAQGLGISSSSSFVGKGAGMTAFSHPAKSGEERFAAASGSRASGAMVFGVMGSFNAGARSQPLSRTGSGSSALPSRDMMGTGIPSGGRTKSNRGRQRDPNLSRGPQVNPPEKGGPTIPLDQVVPLSSSENRWMPQARSGGGVKLDSPEMVQRKVKALLNKLTFDKFDSISNQILEWANKSINENDGRTLRQVIQLVFEKATDEAAWSEMYARLCRKIMEELSQDVKDESLRTSDGKPVVGGHLFRKYLLNRCQEDFERGWAQRDSAIAAAKIKEAEDKAKKESNEKAETEAKDAAERGESAPDKEAELLSEEYYEAQKAKRRGLGLVKFIGELFKLSMLTERIMHVCIKKLLSNATDPEEEEIESLCKLMTTVGKLLDTEKARGHMDVYFQRMKEMSQNEVSINSRMRFMLLDVIELRQCSWIPRHDNSAPKTIAQIHADAARQKQQQEAESAARQGRGGTMSRGGSKRGQVRGEHGPDGWSTVGSAAPLPRPSKAGDLSAFGKIERGASSRPLSFGPTTIFSRKSQGKGSEDGSQPPTRTNSQTNMFSLLNQSGDGDVAAPEERERERPKLNLQPRTKPLPGTDDKAEKADDTKEEAASEEMSDANAKRKIENDVKEFLEIKDVTEGVEAYKTLPENRRSQFVEKIVGIVFDKKEDDVNNVASLLLRLSQDGLLDEEIAMKGFEPHMEFLDDLAMDVPAIYNFAAKLLVGAKLTQEKIEQLGSKIVGEGLKTPKDKLLEKVAAARE